MVKDKCFLLAAVGAPYFFIFGSFEVIIIAQWAH